MCTDLDLSGMYFNITMSDYRFSIPFENLVQQTSSSSSATPECDLYIVRNYETTDNAIQIGDPFFSAFLPVFDVDSELLGLALAARGVEGSSITFVGTSDDPDSDHLMQD